MLLTIEVVTLDFPMLATGQKIQADVVAWEPYRLDSGDIAVLFPFREGFANEGFFKTIQHRFGLHCFGQSTRLGVHRWFVLVWIAYLLAHWTHQWSLPPTLDWKVACESARLVLFPSLVWLQFLKLMQKRVDLAAQFGFEIVLKPLPDIPY